MTNTTTAVFLGILTMTMLFYFIKKKKALYNELERLCPLPLRQQVLLLSESLHPKQFDGARNALINLYGRSAYQYACTAIAEKKVTIPSERLHVNIAASCANDGRFIEAFTIPYHPGSTPS